MVKGVHNVVLNHIIFDDEKHATSFNFILAGPFSGIPKRDRRATVTPAAAEIVAASMV